MENKTNEIDTLNPLKILLIKPIVSGLKWAIVDGTSVVKRGESFTYEELSAIAKRDEIADVFIDCGYNTAEVLTFSQKYKWNCIFGKTANRDGIAQWIEQACSGTRR